MKSLLSLTRLSEVKIISSTPLDDAQRDTGILEAFMALPSLRIVRLQSLGVHYPIDRWLNSTVHPNVSEIHCTHCSLDATHLGQPSRTCGMFTGLQLRPRHPSKARTRGEYGR